jgi:succinate dehydrogenase / fumarate reductase iron-sulfur subunit
MECTFNVFRYDPKKDREPRYQEYRIAVEPNDKILDCLNKIRWELDPSFTFRMSCAHGVCGSDAMRINGICALACQRLVKDYGEGPVLIEPLPNFPVMKDLLVDLTLFFEKYRSVWPYLLPDGSGPEAERIQSPEERLAFDEAIRCILCACCTSACPVTEENEKFLGPAALLRGFRYLFDSRDGESLKRMSMLDNDDGIQGCKTHGKCTEVCPKEIQVTKSLGSVKKRIYDMKQEGKLPT